MVDTGSGYGYHDKGAPVRPLVKTHPVTGRRALQIARHIYRISGMDDGDAQARIGFSRRAVGSTSTPNVPSAVAPSTS